MPAGETEQSPSPWTIDSLHQHLVDAIAALRDWVVAKFQSQEESVKAAIEAQQRLIAEVDRRYEQRFVAQEQAVSLALARVDKEFHEHLQQVREETHAALQAADKAISKQEEAYEARFASVNEFRGQLTDQAQRFMPRSEAEQRANSNGEKIVDLDSRLNTAVAQINSRLDLTAGGASGADKYRATLFALLAAAATLVGLAFALFGRK